MKRIFFFLSVFTFLSLAANAQCFQKGVKIVTFGAGLGIQHYRFTDLTNNIPGTRDTSAALEIPVHLEYGLLGFLGISLNGNYAKYLQGDSSREEAKTIDVVPTLNIHAPFGWEKFDPSVSFGYGFSHFHYVDNSSFGGEANANGGVFNFGVNLRLLFKDDGHFGINFWYEHSSYNFKKGTAKENNGGEVDFALDGPSSNFGLGFSYRFVN